MISLDFMSLIAYLLPGYLISATPHYIFVGRREKETSRAIESIIVSVLFFALLNKTNTVAGFFRAVQAGNIFNSSFLRHLPLLIVFIFAGAIVYSGLFYAWSVAAEQFWGRSRYKFAFDSFSRRKKHGTVWYFKLEGDPRQFRGILAQNDLDEGDDILLKDVKVKEEKQEAKASKYQFFASEMLISRSKAIYLFTRNEGE